MCKSADLFKQKKNTSYPLAFFRGGGGGFDVIFDGFHRLIGKRFVADLSIQTMHPLSQSGKSWEYKVKKKTRTKQNAHACMSTANTNSARKNTINMTSRGGGGALWS